MDLLLPEFGAVYVMSQRITHIKQLHKPADQVAGVIVRDIRKNMLKVRRIWLSQAVNPNGGQQKDSEALHNFRVEIRRLRAWLQQTRDLIRTKTKARKQLKNWAQGSNAGRDLEVMLGLLQQANTEIDHGLSSIPLMQDNTKLEELFSHYPLTLKPRTRISVQREGKTSFANWLADRLSIELEKTLPLFKDEDETLHKARIHIKHMRYLIEPIMSLGHVATQPALIQLKAMQTRLGNLHDLFVLRQRLSDALCDQLNERLSVLLKRPGIPTRGIQQAFSATRNQFTIYLGWQSTQYEAAMKDWHSSSEQTYRQMENTLNSLIDELRNA
jgi:CHAD domain-containing protein